MDTVTLEQFRLIQPRWDIETTTLHVADCPRTDSERSKKVTAFLLYASSWLKFSDTRLVMVEEYSGRHLLSLFMGFDEVYKMVEADPRVTNYYSGGYMRL